MKAWLACPKRSSTGGQGATSSGGGGFARGSGVVGDFEGVASVVLSSEPECEEASELESWW
jgi:hypothetical protein